MQHDDPANAPESGAAKGPSVDINAVQDYIQQLADKSGKIKGINKSRIDTDILEDDIAALLASARLVMSREASVELLKFIKFKVSTGQLSKNYHRVFKSLLGDASLTNLIDGKMSDDERFDILSKCVYRMIQCRPLTFYGADDTALFRDGKNNTDNKDFVTLANNPGMMMDYITYSEMEFSRRIAISAFTHLYKFTGTGYDKISTNPIFIHAHASVRLERPETAEYKKLFVSQQRNTELFNSIKMPGILATFKKPNIGSIFKSSLPNQEFLLIQEKPMLFFNISLYKSMIKEMIENYFADCNRAGIQLQKRVCLRLMAIDLLDSNYTIAGLPDNHKAVIAGLQAAQQAALKLIIDQPDFAKKYPAITAIELRKSYWDNTTANIQHPLIHYNDFSADDMLAELTEPVTGAQEKGSTNDTLLCVNMVCSANAYAGNRIYKNSLSSIEAEFANRSNITTLFNPLLNPAIMRAALLDHLLIRFPSGKLSSLVDIKSALAQAEKTTSQLEVQSSQPTEQSVVAATTETDNRETSPGFKFKQSGTIFSRLKPILIKLGAFFKLLADIFHHVKSALIEMINSRRKP